MEEKDEKRKHKLADIDLTEIDKMFLGLAGTPRTIAFFAVKFGLAYSTTSQKVALLVERKLLIQQKSLGGKKLYQLNLSEVEL
jgi:hypothetical protein